MNETLKFTKNELKEMKKELKFISIGNERDEQRVEEGQTSGEM